MPTILLIDGFRVMIYNRPREHGPAHVHVWKDEAQIVIMLGKGSELPSIIRNTGMRNREMAEAYRIVERHLEQLRTAWRRYHDD